MKHSQANQAGAAGAVMLMATLAIVGGLAACSQEPPAPRVQGTWEQFEAYSKERIWISPDGCQYWVLGYGEDRIMAPRYDKQDPTRVVCK